MANIDNTKQSHVAICSEKEDNKEDSKEGEGNKEEKSYEEGIELSKKKADEGGTSGLDENTGIEFPIAGGECELGFSSIVGLTDTDHGISGVMGTTGGATQLEQCPSPKRDFKIEAGRDLVITAQGGAAVNLGDTHQVVHGDYIENQNIYVLMQGEKGEKPKDEKSFGDTRLHADSPGTYIDTSTLSETFGKSAIEIMKENSKEDYFSNELLFELSKQLETNEIFIKSQQNKMGKDETLLSLLNYCINKNVKSIIDAAERVPGLEKLACDLKYNEELMEKAACQLCDTVHMEKVTNLLVEEFNISLPTIHENGHEDDIAQAKLKIKAELKKLLYTMPNTSEIIKNVANVLKINDILKDSQLLNELVKDNEKEKKKNLQKKQLIQKLNQMNILIPVSKISKEDEPFEKTLTSQLYHGSSDLHRGKKLVIKEMSLENEQMPMILQDIELNKSLHHDNIVPILGCCVLETRNKIWVITEMVKGATLEVLLHKKNLEIAEKVKIALGLTAAINVIHARQRAVIHADITPKNIMIREDTCEAMLLDFGIITYENSSSTATQANNSHANEYMAPEVILNHTEKASHIWSVGCVLAQLFSSTHEDLWTVNPDSKNKNKDIRMMLEKGESPTILKSVDQHVKHLIEKCFAHEPKERITAGKLHDQLSSIKKICISENKSQTTTDEYKSCTSSNNSINIEQISSQAMKMKEIHTNKIPKRLPETKDDSIEVLSKDPINIIQVEDKEQSRMEHCTTLKCYLKIGCIFIILLAFLAGLLYLLVPIKTTESSINTTEVSFNATLTSTSITTTQISINTTRTSNYTALASSINMTQPSINQYYPHCKDKFICKDHRKTKKCIDYSNVCDGNNQCTDGSDENNCQRIFGKWTDKGRVEIRKNGVWGTVCDDGLSKQKYGFTAAKTVCQAAGFHPSFALGNLYDIRAKEEVNNWISSFQLKMWNGGIDFTSLGWTVDLEKSLERCSKGEDWEDCKYVVRLPYRKNMYKYWLAKNGSLVNGSRMNGQNPTVWEKKNENIIHMDNVECVGNENNLKDCSHIEKHDCEKKENFFVHCNQDEPPLHCILYADDIGANKDFTVIGNESYYGDFTKINFDDKAKSFKCLGFWAFFENYDLTGRACFVPDYTKEPKLESVGKLCSFKISSAMRMLGSKNVDSIQLFELSGLKGGLNNIHYEDVKFVGPTYNDKYSSIAISGSSNWMIYENSNFEGRSCCLKSMGSFTMFKTADKFCNMDNMITSIKKNC